MKQSRLVGFSLTLLMLLFVLVAAFIFTFQAQSSLQSRVGEQSNLLTTREAEGTLTAVSAANVAATRDALNNQLAATAAAVDELDRQVNEKLQIIATISAQATTDLAAVNNQLDALQQELASQEPALSLEMLNRPQLVGETLEFLAAASDLQGITQLDVSYGETTTPYSGENRPLFTRIFSQTISTAGPYTITVTAQNANQNRTTAVLTGTVQTADAFRQAEIADTLQSFASQPTLEPVQPPILIRRPGFSQWLAAQFGDLAPESVTRQARVLQAFEMISEEEAAALPDNVVLWQQTDFAALLYDNVAAQLVPISEELLQEWAEWQLVLEATTKNDLPPENSSFDAQLGFQGQVMGEAAMLQGLYLAGGGESAVSPPIPPANAASLPDLPQVLREQLLFPYVQGYQWALNIYQDGGLDGVTAARQPLASTSQVLAGVSTLSEDITLPDLQPVVEDDWQLQGTGVWGAYRLQQMLAIQVEEGIETAVASWVGDQYAVYWREADNALLTVLRLAWNSPTNADIFVNTFDAYAAAVTNRALPITGSDCWQGSNEVFCRFAAETETLLVRAPSDELAEEILQLLPQE